MCLIITYLPVEACFVLFLSFRFSLSPLLSVALFMDSLSLLIAVSPGRCFNPKKYSTSVQRYFTYMLTKSSPRQWTMTIIRDPNLSLDTDMDPDPVEQNYLHVKFLRQFFHRYLILLGLNFNNSIKKILGGRKTSLQKDRVADLACY